MQTLETHLNTRCDEFQQNRLDMLEMLAEMDRLLEQVEGGGGEEHMSRLRKRGKLPIRERIAAVLDRDSAFLELSPLAAWNSNFPVGSGFLAAIGVVSGVECVIIGHDPSVRAGAINDFNAKKQMRALEICRENRLPYLQFVESAGADLRGVTGDPEEEMLKATEHFAESGRLFYEITELSKITSASSSRMSSSK